MIANVLVKQKIRDGHSFDYEVGADMPKMLSLVEVPIRNKKVVGLVIGIKDKSEYATKVISRLLTSGPAFSEIQIELAKILSREFISPIPEVIFSFIPAFNFSDYKKIGSQSSLVKTRQNETISLVIGNILERIIFALKKTKGQSLFVFPTIEQVEYAKDLFQKLIPNSKVDAWHSQLRSSDRATLWQQLLDGQSRIVVSTRHGLFLPFTHLENIYIDDPTNFAYHDDQAPYYNAYKVSRLASRLYKANLFIGEPVPDLLSYAALERKNIKIVNIKTNLKISFRPDWDNEIKNEGLARYLKQILMGGKKIAVVGPWKKEQKYYCMDCRRTQSCQNCQSEYFNGDFCANCKSKVNIEICPICKSAKIKLVRFSYESIREKLKDILSRMELKNVSIISINQLDFTPPHFSLVLVPYFDRTKDFPYLNQREKLFRSIRSLGSTGAKDVILFGDNLKDDELALAIAKGDWKSFFKDELRERKKAKLPPFRQAILLVIKSKSRERNGLIFEKIEKSFKNTFEFAPIDDEPGKVVRSKYLTLIDYKDFDEFAKIASKISFPEAHFEVDPVEFN